MKTIKFLLLILFFSPAILFAQDENKTDAKGLKTGKWTVKYEDGKTTRYTGEFKAGKPIGDFKYYYETGELKSTLKFRSDGKSSYGVFYYTDEDGGKKMSEGKYVDQKKDSTWVYYDNVGYKTYSQEFKEDLEDGKKIIYYVSGDKSEVFTYVKGKKEGAWTQYFESGMMRKTGNYKDDVLWGRVTVYNGESKKKEQELTYKKGVLHGVCSAYDEFGKLIKDIYFDNGVMLKDSEVEEFKKVLLKEKESTGTVKDTKTNTTKSTATKSTGTSTGTKTTTTGTKTTTNGVKK